MTTLFIKNMVCDRCIMVVQNELEQLGLTVNAIKLGEVELQEAPDAPQKVALRARFEKLGFELIDDRKHRIVEKIKTIIITEVHYHGKDSRNNLSYILSQELHHDYNYLSNLFSETEGTTIEKYSIAQKIERVKELLVYDELSLSEIAIRLNYSSVAYLSTQFKKVTGLTPTQFKLLSTNKRTPLDRV